MSATDPPVRDDELHAFVDGQLDPGRRAAVAAWLATEPEAAARVQAWQMQREALRAAFADLSPPRASFNLERMILDARTQRRQRLLWSSGAAAAFILALGLGGAAGWMARAPASNRQKLAMAVLEQEAITTYTVYAVDRRHSIEVAATERDHLTQWLSNRLNRKVTPPDLTSAGWHLLGGRLLATERGGAAALFMYDNDKGQRLSLLMRPMAPDLATPKPQQIGGALNGSAWIIAGLGYALVSEATQPEIMEVARLVREQSPAQPT